MTNFNIRVEAARNGVKLWQVAEKLGMTDSSLSRKLRRELPDAEQQHILTIIEEIRKCREVVNHE